MSIDKFLKLDKEKRERILQGAFEEFTEHTYDDASTNRIIKKAGISKGTLFYYFANKKELYFYLVDYGIEFLQEQFKAGSIHQTRNFIERCKLLAEIDMKMFLEAPYIVEFLSKLYLNQDVIELPEEVAKRLALLSSEMLGELYEDVDTSLFRQDLQPTETMKMIKWVFDGYLKDLMEGLKGQELTYESVKPYFEEFEQLLQGVKKVFYS